jgi:FkbM family methyltransferase
MELMKNKIRQTMINLKVLVLNFLSLMIRKTNIYVLKKKLNNYTLLLFSDQDISFRILFGTFEREETKYLKKVLHADDVCLDIGANIGFYTLLFSSMSSKVISFEPLSLNCSLLNQTIALNNIDNIQLIQAVVSNVNGTVAFNETTQSGYSSVSYGGSSSITNRQQSVIVDEMAIEKLDVVKIDVEGYELKVLQSMLSTLQRTKPRIIMVELVEEYLLRFGDCISDVLELLEGIGYQPKVLSAGELRSYSGQHVPGDNFFFELKI